MATSGKAQEGRKRLRGATEKTPLGQFLASFKARLGN
jgi:hypothetical protein